MSKDCWDKAEVISKVFAGVLTPVVVALSVYLWNVEKSKRDTAAQMASVAVSILMGKPEEVAAGPDPLRSWAISVLRTPQDPPPLSAEAAKALEFNKLSMFWSAPPWWLSSKADEIRMLEDAMNEALEGLEQAEPDKP